MKAHFLRQFLQLLVWHNLVLCEFMPAFQQSASSEQCLRQDLAAFLDFYPFLQYNCGRERTMFDHVKNRWFGGLTCGPVPGLFRRFDWISEYGEEALPGKRAIPNPRTIVTSAWQVDSMIADISRLPQSDDAPTTNRTLVICNAEVPLSEVLGKGKAREMKLRALKKFFRNVFIDVFNVNVEPVRPVPPTLCAEYFGPHIVDAASSAIAEAKLDRESKPREVLVSFGDVPRSNYILDRNAARSRDEASAWAKSKAAENVGAERRITTRLEWWEELSKYRFLLSPDGTAITRPATIEALLVLTIPIVQRGPFPIHDELVRMGYPIVVVDDWNEITRKNLERWWRLLSPRLRSFRENCLTAEAYWRLFTSGISDVCCG